MKRFIFLIAVMILSVTALQACGTSSENNNQTEGNIFNEDNNTADDTSSSTESDKDSTAKSIAYKDSYRTVVTFNMSQIQKLTGYQVEGTSIDRIIDKLQQVETWTAQDFSSSDAVLISEVAGNESNTIETTLDKLIQNRASDLRLVIFHSKYRNTAHFGTNNNNQIEKEISNEGDTTSDNNTEAASSTISEKGSTAKSIAYKDSYKTVVTFNKSQIQKLTGQQVEEASIENIINKLQQVETWTTQDFSSSDAELISEAASSESNTIQTTLDKLIHGRASDLRLVIFHSKYRSTAHFGTNNRN